MSMIKASIKETGEIFEITSKPNIGSFVRKLEKFISQDFELKLCCEATYIVYSVCRELNKNGYKTEIIVSSMIPEVASGTVKAS